MAGVAKRVGLLTMQQGVGLDQVVDVARGTPHRVHQARLGVHADMGLHAEVPLIALLALVHLGVTFPAGALGRARRGDQRGVHHRAGLEQQTLGAQQIVDDHQDLRGQFVLFQQVAKPQDRALVGQPGRPVVQARELPEQRHVVQRLFHRRFAQREPLLHEVNAQHGLQRERRASFVAHRSMRGHQVHQRRPGHHAVDLVEKAALARALHGQVQSKVGLLHGSHSRYRFTTRQAHRCGTFADLP